MDAEGARRPTQRATKAVFFISSSRFGTTRFAFMSFS